MPSAKLFTDIDKLKKGDLFSIHVFDEVLGIWVNQIKIVLPDDVETLEIERKRLYNFDHMHPLRSEFPQTSCGGERVLFISNQNRK